MISLWIVLVVKGHPYPSLGRGQSEVFCSYFHPYETQSETGRDSYARLVIPSRSTAWAWDAACEASLRLLGLFRAECKLIQDLAIVSHI
jgi:hypothetical protein